jgi:KaiC/GvpD/RAD55 family RecA-like ATPase
LTLIFEGLSSFFAKHGRDTNVTELEVYFLSLHPGLTDVEKETFHAVFSNIENLEVSEEVCGEYVGALQQRQALVDLAVSAYEASEGRREIGEVVKALTTLGSEVSSEHLGEVQYVTDDLDELYNKTVKETGLRWPLKSLNNALGSLRRGDFGFVFARPETGKTTFLAHVCTHMASQATSPVLWFNNEEQGEKVMLRCYQAALGLPLEQLFSSIGKAKKQYATFTKGNIKLVDQAVLNKSEVESICASVKPGLIVFDQIDKVTGFKADRDDLVLGAIYQWARELAKLYCPVIGICQADGTAEGVKWLTMAHVANAKTSKQAEADWILGIGRSNDAGYEAVRHFNVSKNKLVGDEDTRPDMRHGRWDVLIEPQIARYKDILE